VLSPEGRLVIAESSQPSGRILGRGFRAYLKAVLGPAGASVSGTKGAYRCLSTSIRNHYSAGEVAALLENAGFADVDYQTLMGGAAAIHCHSSASACRDGFNGVGSRNRKKTRPRAYASNRGAGAAPER